MGCCICSKMAGVGTHNLADDHNAMKCGFVMNEEILGVPTDKNPRDLNVVSL
jgi:hypothetical protein